MFNRYEYPIKLGTIVRYNDGPSALARIHSYHAGGYHGEQVYGGFLFIQHSSCFCLGDEIQVWYQIQKEYPKSPMSIKELKNVKK